jgi:uncharacterized membrane protein YhhN
VSFEISCAITAAAVVGLLVAEYRKSQLGKWICKPIASAGFVAAAWARHALDTPYGKAVMAALVLSFLGDLLLIPKSKKIFQAGILSFLLGHVAFCYAFVVHGVHTASFAGTIVVLVVVAALVGRWLLKHVQGGMRIPVLAYIAVITTMVACAAGTRVPLVFGGAFAFYLSDLSVARDRFVAPGFINRLWGLPLYYGAQLVLAATV